MSGVSALPTTHISIGVGGDGNGHNYLTKYLPEAYV